MGLRTETKVTQRGLGVLSLLWGVVLLWPTNTYGTTPSFNLLAHTIPEDALGAAFALVGLCKIASSLWGSLRVRGFFAALGFGMWLFVALSIFASVAFSTGWVVYSFVAWLSGYNFWQLWLRYNDIRISTHKGNEGNGNDAGSTGNGNGGAQVR